NGVRSIDALTVPLVPSDAFDTDRSKTTGPRTPLVGPLWICAIVAGDRSPSKVPLIDSFEPVSTAETDPAPATVACMAMSMGTGDNRALNVFGGWALRTMRPK